MYHARSLKMLSAKVLQDSAEQSEEVRKELSVFIESRMFSDKSIHMLSEKNQIRFINEVLNTTISTTDRIDVLICLSAMHEELNLSKNILENFIDGYKPLYMRTLPKFLNTSHEINRYALRITRTPSGEFIVCIKNNNNSGIVNANVYRQLKKEILVSINVFTPIIMNAYNSFK